MPTKFANKYAMTMAGLNLIQQALTIYDNNLRLVISNQRFEKMFELPEELTTPGASFADTIRYLASRGEYGPVEDVECFVKDRVDLALAFEPHYFERQSGKGRWISVVSHLVWYQHYLLFHFERLQEMLTFLHYYSS